MSAQKLRTVLLAFVATSLLAGCSEIQRPQPEPFYAETKPPAKQEFRWSNGKMPQSFDPAKAAAAPETDLVRALFEGLTEIDAKTLEAVPAAAEKWTASEDDRVWTFQLRRNARWSNGKRVTPQDFLDSWKRLITLGDKTAHRELFQNIVGFQTARSTVATELPEPAHTSPPMVEDQIRNQNANAVPAPSDDLSAGPRVDPTPPVGSSLPAKRPFGVEAVDETTLRVTLIAPDKDFPKLVAAPIFRPIYGNGSEFVDGMLDNGVVTNGAFNIALVDKAGISLERSETYWNKDAVKLEHVRFVPKDSAESALDAYRKGEIDALTNAQLEPLALKLLAPYEDFRQTTYNAVNLYKFDATRPPYNDRRIREALAIAIDRDQLIAAELGGAPEPASTFLAVTDRQQTPIAFDPEKAKELLETAGFPNGEGVAPIKLLINRNDTQNRLARAVARMWKQNLNLDTDITVKELSEIDAADSSHEFDVIRRGVVLPTADEAVSMWSIFGPSGASQPPEETAAQTVAPGERLAAAATEKTVAPAMTEQDALFELQAIPLYFPRTYSLVKPYVHGFDMNGLDAVYLPGVSIDSNWQPSAQRRES
jgi:oligopeptide transport system substrate-binding protein